MSRKPFYVTGKIPSHFTGSVLIWAFLSFWVVCKGISRAERGSAMFLAVGTAVALSVDYSRPIAGIGSSSLRHSPSVRPS
jgi:hypothetical protein